MHSEKLQKWALTAEIFGGLGVVITLIFLIVEIRGNTQELRFDSVRRAQSQIAETSLYIMENAETYIKALNEPKNLSEAEAMEMGLLIVRRLSVLQDLHQAFLGGLIGEDEWNSWRDGIPIYIGHPFGQAVWKAEREYWLEINREGFVSEIDYANQNSNVDGDRAWLNSILEEIDS